MAYDDIRTAIDRILDEIRKRPEDRLLLQEQLRVKVAELERAGLPVPARCRRTEAELEEEEDFFDNMPV